MANGKKGQLYQFMVPMVDATDFASVESAITESDFNSGATRKFYGCNHGGSAATTSGTISKTASLVRSGVFRLTLKTTENNYDQMMVRISKTGCAEQIIAWENVDYDDSDIMSRLSDLSSDVKSAVYIVNSLVSTEAGGLYTSLTSYMSNVQSDLRSYLAGMSDTLSDVYALLSDMDSNFQSRVPKEVASKSLLSDVNSDLRSYLGGMSDILSDVYALLSDLDSNFQSRVPKEVASKSLLSDVNSDLASKIAGITASVSASDISDIASAVWAAKYVTHSNVSSFGSLIKDVIWSNVSDIRSLVVALSDAISDAHSDLASKIGAITASVSASDISDIASAVWAAKYTAHSNASSFGSLMKDNIYSLLSDLQSDFQSRVPKEVASKSLVSDVNSDLASKIGGITASISPSDISDIVSAIFAADYSDLGVAASTFGSLIRHISSSVSDVDSQLNQTDSVVDDIYSLLSDLNSNFGSRIPKEPAARSQLSDVHSDLHSYMVALSDQLSDAHSDLASDIKSAITAAGLAAAGADITGVPGVTGTYGAKLDWLFALARNKTTQTASLARAFNDAGSQIASATVSDDGTTFQRAEWSG